MRGMKVGEVICRTTPNISDETRHTGYDVCLFCSQFTFFLVMLRLVWRKTAESRDINNSNISGNQQDYLVRKSGSPQI